MLLICPCCKTLKKIILKKHYLLELKRVDFWQWRTEDFLRSSRGDPHQIQEPFPVFVPLGPVNVKRGFDWRLPQVVYLWNKAPRFSSAKNGRDGRDQLYGTHSECEVNQTSDLLLRLNGTFTLHNASERDQIGPGLSGEDSQWCDITHPWQLCHVYCD